VSVWVVAFLTFGAVFGFLAVLRNQRRIAAERSSTVQLHVDGLGVRRVLADGREEGLDWSELTEVEVLTAKHGPHGRYGGVIILSGDEERGCLVPIDQLDTSGVLEALTRLPGFDVRRLTAAMEESPPKLTSCWCASKPE
jgi:hypothetical protein